MDFYKALKCLSLKAVINPSYEDFLRSVHRYYSKTFSTPLTEVEKLPLDYVLRAYYEDIFEKMDEDERYAELDILIETEEETKARLAKEKAVEEAGDKLFESLNKQVKESIGKDLKINKKMEDIKKKLSLGQQENKKEKKPNNLRLVQEKQEQEESDLDLPLINMNFDDKGISQSPKQENNLSASDFENLDPLGNISKH
jgi:hypothetical protein